MTKVIARYPIKIGEVLVPRGTAGEVADITDIQKDFPNIKYKNESEQVAVKFLGLKACIVHTSQLLFQ